MKKLITVLFMFGLLMVVPQVQANELPSCDDLAEMANSLEDLTNALKEVGTITEGDEVDNSLGELLEALSTVARIEDDPYLSKSVKQLSEAWENMDGGKLMRALDKVIEDFDVILGKECT